ncbi:Cyclin-dependent kinase inhibitor 7-like protein [Drosera capensis]
MRRCVRKCRGTTPEVAVVGVAELGGGEGVRITRARALAMAANAASASGRKRIRTQSRSDLARTWANDRLRRQQRRGGLVFAVEILVDCSSTAASCVDEANCGKTCDDENDDDDGVAVATAGSSCCSTNASAEDRVSIHDPVDESGGGDDDEDVLEETNPMMNSNCRKRRQITPSIESQAESEERMDSAATLPSPDPNDLHDGRATVQSMPSESEIEQFFTAAEKDLHQRFIGKYNYDVVKDVPLQGRYPWVPVNP